MDSTYFAIVIGGGLGGLFYLFFIMIFFDQIENKKRARKFKEDLKKAIHNRELSALQISTLAESRNVDYQTAQEIAKEILGDLLVEQEGKSEHMKQLENYLSHMKAIEPFEGVPSELRIHLERLKDQFSSAGTLLDPLAMQIKELARVHSRASRIQKYYTTGGFFVGIAGIVIAIWMYLNPQISTASTEAQKNTVLEKATGP